MAASPASPLVVHVQVADFLVEAERFGVPALSGRPVVVGGARGAPGRVVAASAEARARGVLPGQPLRAAALLCPDASFRAGDLERQHDLRALVDEVIRRHVRQLAWTSIDEAVVGVALGDTAAARRTAENIQAAARHEVGVSLAVGVAATALAARTAARMGLPRGLVVVLPGYDARFLAGLPIEDFDVLDPRSRRRLRAEGLATVGAIARLADDRALALLGRGGAAIARLARGEATTPPEMTSLPRRLCRQAPLAGSDKADEVVHRLAHDVSAALRRHGCAATTLGLRAEDADAASRTHTAPLTEPVDDAVTIAAVARRLQARLAGYGSKARLLSLSASGLVETPPQGDLFGSLRSTPPKSDSAPGPGRPVDWRRLAG